MKRFPFANKKIKEVKIVVRIWYLPWPPTNLSRTWSREAAGFSPVISDNV